MFPTPQLKPITKPQKCKFTPQDDILLMRLVLSSPVVDWSFIASRMKNRNARQCRERWQNYLDPKLVQDNFTNEEDAFIIQKHRELGPRWNAIARFFNGRSGNSIRNRYLLIKRHEKKQNKPHDSEIPIQKQTLNKLESPRQHIVPQIYYPMPVINSPNTHTLLQPQTSIVQTPVYQIPQFSQNLNESINLNTFSTIKANDFFDDDEYDSPFDDILGSNSMTAQLFGEDDFHFHQPLMIDQ